MTSASENARFRVGSGVAVEGERGADVRVYVAPLPDGPLLCLEGTGALIWEEAVRGGESPVPARVAQAVGRPVDEVAPDVERFLAELVGRGLLVEVENADSTATHQPG